MTSPYPSFAALSMYIYIYSYICMVPIYVKSLQRYYIRSPCSLGCMGSNHQSSPTLGLPYYIGISWNYYIQVYQTTIYIYVVIQYAIYVYIVAFSHNKVYLLYPLIYICKTIVCAAGLDPLAWSCVHEHYDHNTPHCRPTSRRNRIRTSYRLNEPIGSRLDLNQLHWI